MKLKNTFPPKIPLWVTLVFSLTLLLSFAPQLMAARIIDENYEGAGYEEGWTEDVSPNCTLNEDASIPGTPPTGAGSQCLQATVESATNDEAYAYQSQITGQQTSYVRGYLYLDQEGFNSNNYFITLGLYTGGGETVTRVLVGEIGGQLKMRFEYYDGGLKHPQNDWGTALDVSIALDTWYRVEYRYDTSQYGGWEFRVDGNTIDSGDLLSTTRTPKTMLTGIMHNNGPGTSTLHTDLVVWDTSEWPGEEPSGPTTHYVDRDTGNDGNAPYPQTNPAKTIQAAIDYCAATSGAGTVYVRKASGYYASITMEDNVDVIGMDGSWAPSDAPDYSDCPTISPYQAPAVTFGGSNCTLEGFEIAGNSSGAVRMTGGGSGYLINIAVKDCLIHGAPAAVNIGGYNGATIEGCDITGWLGGIVTNTYSIYPSGVPIVIKNNVIHDLDRGGIALTGDPADNGGIQLTIQGNQIYNTDRGGIYLYGLGDYCDVTIDNNDIHHCGLYSAEQYGGINIVDVSSVTISRNNIYDNDRAGIALEGKSDVTIGADLAAADPFAWGNDIYGNHAGVHTGSKWGQAVNGELIIRGNYIYNNTGISTQGAGIYFGVAVLSATITENEITQNQLGGIGVRGAPPSTPVTLVIAKNNIHNNLLRGGIHTGNKNGNFTNPGIFTADSAIKQNKVHHHSNANYGGGIDVRHFKGTIKNNLVYRNSRGGIRFGEYALEIVNNTSVNNGDSTEDRGGGIQYHSIGGGLNAPPSGTAPATVLIRNNISAYNEKAGLRVGGQGSSCPAVQNYTDGDPYRDYNLLYGNYPWNDVFNRENPADCKWFQDGGVAYTWDMSCTQQQFGECGAHVAPGGPSPFVLNGPHDVMADPGFVDMAQDNYHLTNPSAYPGDDGGQRGAYGGSDPLVDGEIPQF